MEAASIRITMAEDKGRFIQTVSILGHMGINRFYGAKHLLGVEGDAHGGRKLSGSLAPSRIDEAAA